MQTLFVDHLTVIDFAFFHHDRGIVGESWLLDVELEGELDDQGMVFDFAHVKKQIKEQMDNLVDHKFVVPEQSKFIHLKTTGDELELELKDKKNRHYRHISPTEGVVLIPAEVITPSVIVAFAKQQLKESLPGNVKEITLKLYPENISGNFYHYAHGLKKHQGDCQRIAHGHRSKIQIWENDERSTYWESYWAEKWKDIYIASTEDVESEFQTEGIEYLRFHYQAQQGEFVLELPKAQCYLMDTDTTVELIANNIAQTLKQLSPHSTFKVKAYEGVNKGATAKA